MDKLKKLFRKKPRVESDSHQPTLHKLKDMEEMLEKKQVYIEEKIKEQLQLAKKHGMKNKHAALLALKRKKRFEIMLQQLDNTLTTIELQRETLEQAKNNVEVLHAMQAAATSIKSAQNNLDVDKIHDVMDDIAEQQEVAKEISDAISSPFNHSDIDEKELEKELEELEQEELDKELLNIHLSSHGGTKTDEEGPAASPHAQPASTNSNNKDGQKSSALTEEEKELEELAQWAN